MLFQRILPEHIWSYDIDLRALWPPAHALFRRSYLELVLLVNPLLVFYAIRPRSWKSIAVGLIMALSSYLCVAVVPLGMIGSLLLTGVAQLLSIPFGLSLPYVAGTMSLCSAAVSTLADKYILKLCRWPSRQPGLLRLLFLANLLCAAGALYETVAISAEYQRWPE